MPRGDAPRNARSVRRLSSGTCLLKRGRRVFVRTEENQRSNGRLPRISFVHTVRRTESSVFFRRNATCIEPRRDLYLFALVRVDMSMRICTAAPGLSLGKESPVLENWKVIENYGAYPRFSTTFGNSCERRARYTTVRPICSKLRNYSGSL